jgi:hypothetical protein
MRALLTATIYFGSFLAIGFLARAAAKRWMDRSGTELSDLQSQAGTKRRKHRAFLLGAWRNEEQSPQCPNLSGRLSYLVSARVRLLADSVL